MPPRKSGGAPRERLLSPERAAERRAALQAELAALEEQDSRRYAAIGRAVERYAEGNTGFAGELRRILEETVTDKGERACLGLAQPRRGGGRRRAAAAPAQATQATADATSTTETDLISS